MFIIYLKIRTNFFAEAGNLKIKKIEKKEGN